MGTPTRPLHRLMLPASIRLALTQQAIRPSMAERLAEERRQKVAAQLAMDRQAEDASLTLPLTTAAVIGALNDLTPADPSPADFTGGGGAFSGAGASGEF